MPQSVRRPADIEFTVFRGSDALRDGLLGSKALRGPGWTRLRYDVYADSRLDRDHHLACRAAAVTLPETAVISGRSAAYLLGVEHAAEFRDPVHVTLPPGVPRPRGAMVVHRTNLEPGHVDALPWCRHTNAARTAWDLAAWHGEVDSVPVLDSMLRIGLVLPADLEAVRLTREGHRGCRRVRRAFDLADGRAQSPPESRMRVRLVLAGLPKPVPQFPVVVPSGRVLHPDAAWPEYKVAAEYDGAWHGADAPLDLDRRRLNTLVGAGWLVFHATNTRMGRGFPSFVREIRDGLISRGWSPPRGGPGRR
jgi:hypothetical protein